MNGAALKSYAFFDVDGTVIGCDSFMFIARHVARHAPWRLLPAALALPLFLVTKWLHLDRRWAKSILLWCATVGRGRRGAVRFLHDEIGAALRAQWYFEVNANLARVRSAGLEVCYVSASGQCWLRGLIDACDPAPKRIIGSRLGFFLGGVVLTSPNCYREEKLRRIDATLGHDIRWAEAYSDHPADIPMLRRCEKRYLVSPRAKHMSQFQAAFGNDFERLNWTVKRLHD